ncbi:MAG TPA: S1 RNA-binding domain-containing protein [Acidimicrobiales bacterium]
MQAAMKVKHVIVDGSNIATEGRDAPSLAQLDEAVTAFVEEYSPKYVTVVVDATFPNRIDRKERQTYEDAVNANELITPPAGAIGRGDAFILQIARRADAAILSNDSFQEFHGEYPWLFDKGRLIGGKPVPHVGWVFMDRAPVRGPTSRRAVSEARKSEARKVTKAAAKAAAAAEATAAPEPSTPPPAPRKRRTRAKAASEPAPEVAAEAVAVAPAEEPEAAVTASGDGGGAAGSRVPKGVEPYNEALPFIEFVAQHPVGREVDAEIERFSSHGAYVLVGAARAYIPLRNLAHPAPRSAKEVLRIGETRRFVVVAIDPPRRGIDLALPGVVEPAPGPGGDEAMADVLAGGDGEAPEAAAEPAPARKAAGRRSAGRKSAAQKAPAEKSPAKKAHAKKAHAEKAPARKASSRKAAARQATSDPAATDPAATEQAESAAGDDHGAAEAAVAAPAGKTADTAPAKRARATKKATSRKAAAGRATEEPASATRKATARTATEEPASTTRKATEGRATAKAASARKAPGTGKTSARKASRTRKSTASKAAAAKQAAGNNEVAASSVPEVITLAPGGDDGGVQPEQVSEAAGG